MAEKGAEGPPLVLMDTNVIIEGAISLARGVKSPEASIWLAFLEGRLMAAFSETLLLKSSRLHGGWPARISPPN